MDFLRPGLKTGVGNGTFGLKLGLDLEIRAGHPHQKFQRVPPLPPPRANLVVKCLGYSW